MSSLKTITNEIEGAKNLKSVVETYKLVAASSMRRIRNFVLENRLFHLGLNGIYQEVKQSYVGVVAGGMKKKGGGGKKKVLPAKKKSGSVYVLVSANTGLYGEIIYKTLTKFIEAVREENPDEVVVLGKIGESFFKEAMPERKFIHFDFPDTKMIPDVFKKIAQHLKEFERVVVFHGVFRSFLSQLPVGSHISGEILSGDGKNVEKTRYIFEPSLESVALFFETEIFASLLEQSFHESRLAKLASRTMLLDRSGQTIDGFISKIFLQKQKILHRTLAVRQMDTVRGIVSIK